MGHRPSRRPTGRWRRHGTAAAEGIGRAIVEPGYSGRAEWPPRRIAARGSRGRLALYAALTVLVLALTVLAWNVVAGGTPERSGTVAGGPESPTEGGASGTDSASESPGPPGSALREADDQRPSGRSALTANPLYDTGRLAPLPCPAPELDVDSPSSMERFLNTMADCLDNAWSTQFRKAGLPFDPPRRVFWSDPGSSPCREYPSQAGAFYCRASKSIYIGTSDVVAKWNEAENSALYASLLAHEYGHHVQGESGMLDYYHEQRNQEPDRAAKNAWTRRSELQANCFAGVFLGAVEVSYPLTEKDRRAVIEDAAATADRPDSPDEERTHGSAANSKRWTRHGLEKQSPAACDTWDVENEDLVQ